MGTTETQGRSRIRGPANTLLVLLDASNRRFGATNRASAEHGEAPFPTAFADARNLVAGPPLVLAGTPTSSPGL
jgi:hypothetical protein